ncbi:MAG: hypothetical protein ACLFMP_04250 [Desulfonatronovibrionaceae bacterium]
MKMQKVRELGKKHGLSFKVGSTKVNAIRAIQRSEGNFDCFARAGNKYCDQENCLFYQDCMQLSDKN